MPHPASRSLLLPGTLLLAVCAAADAGPTRPVVPGFERFHAGDKAAGGRLLTAELGCAACHQGGPALRQAPVLDHVADRVRPSHLRKFLRDPHSTKPGTLMPHLLHDDPEKEQKVEALVHLLASTGTLKHERPAPKGLSLGRDLYHKVGCVACHGTRDAKGDAAMTVSTSVPLGDLKAKYTIAGLGAFLADPLHARPSGRMPRLLTNAEAKYVATYLLQGIKTPLSGRGTTTFAYYEGSWDNLPDFAKLKPLYSGVASGFDIGVARREYNYALKFDAVWKVEREALYSFVLASDDGSRLHVDGKQLVDVDGLHATQANEGKVQLEKGIHKISVIYFQGGGEASLDVRVKATGFGDRSLGDLVAADEAGLNPKPKSDPADPDAIVIRPELVAKGKDLFASLGCAACHQLKRDGKAVPSSLKASPLTSSASGKGCLSATPARGVPSFGLNDVQREAIAAGLASKPPAHTPQMVVAETMTAFNCYACHIRDKVGGAQEELNKLFLTTQPEMGDEGRLPPPLDGVGAKLNPDYFKQLLDKGAHDRPYMHTRMPGFGAANVGAFLEATRSLDKLPPAPNVTFKDPEHRVKSDARHLTGSLALGCIKCHTFNGVKAEGVQGIDMTLMPRRLSRDWFHAYVAEPQKVRPGTRMPASYLGGKSVLPDVLDGTANTQIEAMWLYLKDGKKARLPVGMGKVSIPLVPFDAAIVYRNFLEGAGTRAIGVGYPEKANLAFDANEGRVAMIWQGAFLDAARHWTDRGSGAEGPLGDNVLRLPSGAAFARLDKPDDRWPTGTPKSLGYRFKGYRLSKDDRPTFLYAIGDVAVADFPTAMASGKDVSLKRTFDLTATSPIDNLYYRAAVGNKIEPVGDGWYRVDGAWKVKLLAGAKVRKAGGKAELVVPIRLVDGKTRLVQEYSW